MPLGDNVDAPAVQALLTPHSPGLMTLVAPLEPGTAESVPASLVAHILEVLRDCSTTSWWTPRRPSPTRC